MSMPPDSPYGQGYGSSAGPQYGSGAQYPSGQYDPYGSGYSQPQQTGYEQPGYGAAGYQQTGYTQPGYGQHAAPSGGGYPGPAPTSRSRVWLAPVVALITLAAGLGVGILARGEDPPITPAALPAVTVTTTTNAPAETETVTETVTATKETSAPPTTNRKVVRDGLWRVGVDIDPGMYLAAIPSSGPTCMVRLQQTTDPKTTTYAGEGVPGTLTKFRIPASSPYFYSENCGGWVWVEE